MSPFDALGLPARPDLTDGGDVARYTAATSAYVTLRTPWGRSEAYADVTASADDTSPLPVLSGAAGPDEAEVPDEPLVGPGKLVAAYTWQLPARIRHGLPVRLLIRGLVAVLLCLGVLAEIPGQPAAPPLVAALITWFIVTGRSDLAPPRHR